MEAQHLGLKYNFGALEAYSRVEEAQPLEMQTFTVVVEHGER
jgi:hypothetical protein